MTSKVLIYYSLKGNTKGIIDNVDFSDCDVFNLRKTSNIQLNKYDTIFIGTSTYGRGVPPQVFFDMKDDLIKLKGKKIGLFGSGQTHYEYFCGALDLLEEILKPNNQIIFTFKFEGYPNQRSINEFKRIMEEIKSEDC